MFEHAVMIRFHYKQKNLASLHNLETVLEEAIDEAGVGHFDGNDMQPDFGAGYLYMYGPDANELFRVVRPILESAPFMHDATARLRFGPPNTRGVAERKAVLSAAKRAMPVG